MDKPLHHDTTNWSKTTWVTPATYSWRWLRRDWDVARGPHYLTGEEPSDSLLVLLLRSVYWLANAISPWEWLNYLLVRLRRRPQVWLHSHDGLKARYWVADIYTVASTILVWAVAQWAAHSQPLDDNQRLLIALVMGWRLFEVWRVMLRVVIIDYLGEGHAHTTVSTLRYLLYIPLYVFQVILIFAAIYLVWTPAGFTSVALPPLATLHQFAYVSLMTMTTIGSGYTATSEAAQTWQAFESITSLVLFGIGLTTFLSGLKLSVRRRR